MRRRDMTGMEMAGYVGFMGGMLTITAGGINLVYPINAVHKSMWNGQPIEQSIREVKESGDTYSTPTLLATGIGLSVASLCIGNLGRRNESDEILEKY